MRLTIYVHTVRKSSLALWRIKMKPNGTRTMHSIPHATRHAPALQPNAAAPRFLHYEPLSNTLRRKPMECAMACCTSGMACQCGKETKVCGSER